MKRYRFTLPVLAALFILVNSSSSAQARDAAPAAAAPLPGGELLILGPDGTEAGICPLKHTQVTAEISGFVGRTQVRQVFHNPSQEKIEAVYAFPLPQDAAAHEMIMTVGDRRVVGQIHERDEARRIYEAARSRGHVAGLLDQERPNIFTQSVANIEPGAEVIIEIGYVETLKYEDGWFEFAFPMVVGPRYMPGMPSGHSGTGWAPDTHDVPDASKISPPVTPEGTRAGHDISLTVRINAGMPIHDIQSTLHRIDLARADDGRSATVALANQREIPNRDFILRYRTAGEEIADALLVHEDPRGRFFTLILQPPQRVTPEQARPKEMIFVIDKSGSMMGFPIEKARQTMRLAIEQMNPHDTFNLIIFDGGTGQCFDRPVPNTPENRQAALRFLEDLRGGGGTEMMPAVHRALEGQDPQRLRVVCFMTDGLVGNGMAIIDAVKKNAGTARVFSFGIGNAVNRFLLDGMAHAGRGEVEYVTLESEGDAAAKRFHERIHSPVLTDITIDWGDVAVEEVYPAAIPDLFSAKPIMIHGRLAGEPRGRITLRGRTAAGDFEREIDLAPAAPAAPAAEAEHPALPSLWARAKVADLMNRDLSAMQRRQFPDDLKQQIIATGIEYGLMTQFTSFVAVEEMTVTVGGEPRTIAVPVEMPQGVSYEGVFGPRRRSGGGGGFAGVQVGEYEVAARSRVVPATVAAQEPPATLEQRERYQYPAADDSAAGPADPQARLDEALRDLAEKVETQGQDGNLAIDGLRVIDHQVDVMIHLRDVTPQTLEALEKLGFAETGRSSVANLLIGTIDVRKLKELAELAAVLRVTPVT